jgi:hypothetical protein
MASQISQSPQRAFTWTGPYGGGKSSLAIALAGLVGPKGAVRTAAAEAVGPAASEKILQAFDPGRNGWLIVPVVGRRGNAVSDIGNALEAARRKDGNLRGRPRGEVVSGRELLDRLVQEAEERPRDGVLLIIDEMGKFLESAAAEGGDIYFFQELAEIAARSKGRIVVVGILHQAFEQYANRLGRETRDEWAKIQGRFIDIPLIAPVDEVIDLLGQAIVSGRRHAGTLDTAEAVAQSIRSRRPGSAGDLGRRLDRCWPLHPVTAALLGPMSRRRFGQNERSVFGFLSSAEPGGFQEFVRNATANSGELFGPERFWDYLRINLEPAILASNDSHRWSQAVDAVERCEARGTTLHIQLAKSIALIDMFRNGSGLAADRVTVGTCVKDASKAQIDAALSDLERWSVAVFRKHLGAWASYAGSDFDIDGAVASALAQTPDLDLDRLARLADLQPIPAKRHYYETGTLRWFQTDLAELGTLKGKASGRVSDAAGCFLLLIPSGDQDRRGLADACREASEAMSGHLMVVGLPHNAQRIRDLGRELIGLESIRSSRPELDGDSVARREINARVAALSSDLEEEFRIAFTNADWFVEGVRVELRSGGGLFRLASDLCDSKFAQAPCIRSELVNRQRPSTNTQAGIRELLRAMIAAPEKDALGIEAFPVERGLYSTVLHSSGLHRDLGQGHFGFSKPSNSKIGKTFKPAWEAAERLFCAESEPVPLGRLYDLWSAPPFGIRRGVMPLLSAAFMLANRHRFAVYGEGRFQADIDDFLLDLLLQDPNKIALRAVSVDAFRGAVLDGLAAALKSATGESSPTDPLELARRLVRLARDLPPWTRKTLGLSQATIQVRHVLLLADDPHKALFIDLPALFGEGDASATAKGIEAALQELTSAYPSMLTQLSEKMLQALGHQPAADFVDLHARADNVLGLTGDLLLDAFAKNLASYSGKFSEIEAIAGLTGRPTRDWADRDPDQAALAIADLALRFRKAEALARVKGRRPAREAMAMVIGTGEDGSTVFGEFEVAESDRPRVAALTEEIAKLLSRFEADRSIVLAALVATGVNALSTPAARIRKAS